MEPINKRQFATFISHAHADKQIVDKIYNWLLEAGVAVWYDARYLNAGAKIASDLGKFIEQCRSIVIVLSKKSVESGWVKEEFDASVEQRAQSKEQFKIIPIRIEECEVPAFLRTTKWIDLLGGSLTLETASELLLALYDADIALDLGKTREVYVSRSWHDHPDTEYLLPTAVCNVAAHMGFRLIGDSKDQKGFKTGNRVETIINSCGGLIAVVPDRGNGTTSKYILQEIEFARKADMPYVVIAEEAVQLSPEILDTSLHTIRIPKSIITDSAAIEQQVKGAISALEYEWRPSKAPHYTFFGTNFDKENIVRNQVVERIIEQVTSMPCVMGENIHEGHIQSMIADQIRNSFMMIADISKDNLNTCIEAGIALGANVPLHLVAQGERHGPPFMFRDQQIWYYESDVDLLGKIHKIVYPYRRRTINFELPRTLHM